MAEIWGRYDSHPDAESSTGDQGSRRDSRIRPDDIRLRPELPGPEPGAASFDPQSFPGFQPLFSQYSISCLVMISDTPNARRNRHSKVSWLEGGPPGQSWRQRDSDLCHASSRHPGLNG
jgi:hypothetical protein